MTKEPQHRPALRGDFLRPAPQSVGIGCRVLWLASIAAAQAWGLLLLNAAMWWVTIRNYRKWGNA